jgi:hypothetical protein
MCDPRPAADVECPGVGATLRIVKDPMEDAVKVPVKVAGVETAIATVKV